MSNASAYERRVSEINTQLGEFERVASQLCVQRCTLPIGGDQRRDESGEIDWCLCAAAVSGDEDGFLVDEMHLKRERRISKAFGG